MGLLSLDDFGSGDGSLASKMESLAVDSSANFLNGQATSTFSKAGGALSGTVAGAAGLAAVGMNADAIALEVAEQLMGLAVAKIEEVVQQEVQKIATAMISIPASVPGKIQSKAMETFNQNKKSLSDLMGEIDSSAEEQQEKAEEDAKKESEEKKKKSAKEKLDKVKNSVGGAIDKVNKGMANICAYVEAGPKWLLTKTNALLDEQVKFVTDQTDAAIKSVQKGVDEFCEARGQAIGEKMAEKYNKKLEVQAKDKIVKIEKQKKKAKTKANTAIQKGILKIMAMTGIAIPFSPSV